jgi:hypothetical protein
MKPDSMLVEPRHILRARQEVAAKGSGLFLSELADMESALASFLSESLVSVAGKLSLSGAPTELVQGLHEDVLTVVLTCLQALRHGHYAIWKDTVIGTRLVELDPSLQPRPRRCRRKDQPINTEQEGAA